MFKTLVPRPPLNAMPGEYSFPSGSAMAMLAATAVLVVTLPLARRALAIVALALLVLLQGAILVSTR